MSPKMMTFGRQAVKGENQQLIGNSREKIGPGQALKTQTKL